MSPGKSSLRAKLTGFFLLAALPGALLAGAAAVGVDRLLASEIERRTADTMRLTVGALDREAARARAVVDGLAASDRIEELLPTLERAHDDRFQELVAERAAAEGLEILAIVAARGPDKGRLLASAHLPGAVGDQGPPFLEALKDETGTGLAHEYVEGNPPELAPALIAARVLDSPAGQPALYLYGGVRLDGHRLQTLAAMAGASLTLRSPGLRPRHAGQGQAATTAHLALPALLGGLSTVEAEADTDGEPRIEVGIPSGRLEEARSLLTSLAGGLLAASLLIGFVASSYFSRRLSQPIFELSDAAKAVGRGDLSVRVTPRSADEVGELVAVFNQMTDELSASRERIRRAERVAAWQQIARRVAHEIKNPLSPIQMTMETLRKSYRNKHEKLDEIVEESTRTVLEEVRALNRIVTEFSDFARLPALNKEPVQVLELLSHVASLYEHNSGSKVVLDRDGLQALPSLELDREQIQRALINLVKNGLEALADKAGTVFISARAADKDGRKGVRLCVSDDGPGMAKEALERLFTPYFTTKESGTGLGLAMVERIVSEHDGHIDVTSSPAGTRFELWLPEVGAPVSRRPEQSDRSA